MPEQAQAAGSSGGRRKPPVHQPDGASRRFISRTAQAAGSSAGRREPPVHQPDGASRRFISRTAQAAGCSANTYPPRTGRWRGSADGIGGLLR
jgi:hypothetical protein